MQLVSVNPDRWRLSVLFSREHCASRLHAVRLSTVKHLVSRKTRRRESERRINHHRAPSVRRSVGRSDFDRPTDRRTASVRSLPAEPLTMRVAVYRPTDGQTQQAPPAFPPSSRRGSLSLSLSLSPRVMLILSHAAGRAHLAACLPTRRRSRSPDRSLARSLPSLCWSTIHARVEVSTVAGCRCNRPDQLAAAAASARDYHGT